MHLLLMRSCNDYVFSKYSQYGTHQRMERNITQRRYILNDVRQGYNTPFATQWHFMEYRCKKEVLPEFVNDLQARVLNPTPNNTNLIGLFRSDKIRSVGRLFYLIQYIFKWLNRFPFKYLHPLKPVPVLKNVTANRFLDNGEWAYNYIFGCLEDPIEKIGDEVSGKEYKQDDIL